MQQPKPNSRPNLFYSLAVLAGFCFVITILAAIAVLFGDNSAPAAKLFNSYVNMIFFIEVLIALSCGLAGMAYDRGPVTPPAEATSERENDVARNETNTKEVSGPTSLATPAAESDLS